jgi:hypothetical protein
MSGNCLAFYRFANNVLKQGYGNLFSNGYHLLTQVHQRPLLH